MLCIAAGMKNHPMTERHAQHRLYRTSSQGTYRSSSFEFLCDDRTVRVVGDEFQLDPGHGQFVPDGLELDAGVECVAVDPEIDGFHKLTVVVADVDGFEIVVHGYSWVNSDFETKTGTLLLAEFARGLLWTLCQFLNCPQQARPIDGLHLNCFANGQGGQLPRNRFQVKAAIAADLFVLSEFRCWVHLVPLAVCTQRLPLLLLW